MNLQDLRPAGLIAAAALAMTLAACGDDANDTPSEDTPVETTDTPEPAATPEVEPVPEAVPEAAPEPEPTPEPTPEPAATPDEAATPEAAPEPAEEAAQDETYEPGPLRVRVVNFLDQPVDVYARTNGLVRAYPETLGLEPGGVTDFFNPPEGGRYLVTTAGAGDATCVAQCPHFISDETLFAEDGDAYTVILYDNGGRPYGLRLWENPPAVRAEMANAMVPAEADVGVVVVTAVAVTDATFGMWLGIEGVPGCQVSTNLTENILVGGNQTPAFTYEGDSVGILFYGNQDRECAGDPVGGPFTVTGGPGTRTHLLLFGSPGALEAITLPFAEPTP